MLLRRRQRVVEKHRSRIKFPYGDFEDVQRRAVLATESRAGQYKYADIEMTAAYLHGMLNELQQSRPDFEMERSRASAR